MPKKNLVVDVVKQFMNTGLLFKPAKMYGDDWYIRSSIQVAAPISSNEVSVF